MISVSFIRRINNMDSYYDVNELKTLGIRFTRGG